MFQDATNFNQNISNWNVSNVYDMSYMFYNATSFSQTLSWTVGKYTGTRNMFVNTAQTEQAKRICCKK